MKTINYKSARISCNQVYKDFIYRVELNKTACNFGSLVDAKTYVDLIYNEIKRKKHTDNKKVNAFSSEHAHILGDDII